MQDLFTLEGKTALVTGGSRGIGLMIARGYVRAGARVYISSRKADVCEEVAAELSKEGECIALPADLSGMEGIESLSGALTEREDALHVLVNNAGAAWGAPLEEYPESGWDKVMDLNVKGPFFLTVRLLPLLRVAATADDPARVINIGSIDGIRVPMLQNYAYSASKAGLHMLTRHMAHHLVDDHITINAIAPGPFPSRMTKFMFDMGEDVVASQVPLGRPGKEEDAAAAAIFLAAKSGSYLTGAVIPLDGGISTR
jgi:NAD(P)-dependent dehydrogenase (short-subunit alcohol dehydrogenase family)